MSEREKKEPLSTTNPHIALVSEDYGLFDDANYEDIVKKHGIHLFYIIGGEGEEGEEKVNIYASMKAYNEACRRIGTLYQDRYVPALIRCTLLAVALTGMRLEGWSPDEVVEEQ